MLIFTSTVLKQSAMPRKDGVVTIGKEKSKSESCALFRILSKKSAGVEGDKCWEVGVGGNKVQSYMYYPNAL